MDLGFWRCDVVAFEGRASFPWWARPGQPTAPRRRTDPQGKPILERGICSLSQVLNFWYDAVWEAIDQADAVAWDQVPLLGPADARKSSTPQPEAPEVPQTGLPKRPIVCWAYYAQNHWRRAVRDILQRASTRLAGCSRPAAAPSGEVSGDSVPGRQVCLSGTEESEPLLESKPTRESEPPLASQSPSGPPKEAAVWGLQGPSGIAGWSGLVLLGFSNGGDAVYQTAQALGRRGLGVDLVITVDPVRKPLRGIGWLGFHRPGNVRRWINFYQRFDRRTLAGLLPIVGRHVDGADENIQMHPEDFPDPKTRPKAHLWIPSLAQVRQRIVQELVALLSRRDLG